MKLLLTRLACTWRGTIGLLEGPGIELWTIEQPWRDNRPFKSCVPVGPYDLVPHNSLKYPNTYALVGGSVSHQYSPDHERYACLIHIGNTMDDVSGCVAVGVNGGFLNHLPGVVRSRVAMDRLRQALGADTHTLQIRSNGLAI